uniref:Haloacid dehalogenase-like hydrolase family protein n=1 Tax=Arundo donax TaxID=35708 RepID=A0A0A8YL52_ARUDO
MPVLPDKSATLRASMTAGRAFPVAITMFTPLDLASLRASAFLAETWLLLLSSVPSISQKIYLNLGL